jgi:Helix-turn-helix domain
MDDTLYQHFFDRPACPAQRQYEALRAVFSGGLSQKDAAERFGYAYDAFRQLVHQFRRDCAAGTPPPFSPLTVADDPRGRPSRRPHGPTPLTVPMSAS